jgi:hypothetical protein
MPAPVNQSGGPPPDAWTQRTDFAGGANPVYDGWARSTQLNPPLLTVVSVSKAADASFNVTGHGVEVGYRIEILGATGAWAAINGVKNVKAVTNADAFTIEDSTAGFAGAFDGSVRVLAPRQIDPVWTITKSEWTDNNRTALKCADGDTQDDNVFANRATLNYQ